MNSKINREILFLFIIGILISTFFTLSFTDYLQSERETIEYDRVIINGYDAIKVKDVNDSKITLNLDVTGERYNKIAFMIPWYNLDINLAYEMRNSSGALYYEENQLNSSKTIFIKEISFDKQYEEQIVPLYIINLDNDPIEVKYIINFKDDAGISFNGILILINAVSLILGIVLSIIFSIIRFQSYKKKVMLEKQTIENDFLIELPEKIRYKWFFDEEEIENPKTFKELLEIWRGSKEKRPWLFIVIGIFLILIIIGRYLDTFIFNVGYFLQFLFSLFLDVEGTSQKFIYDLAILPFEIRIICSFITVFCYLIGFLVILLGIGILMNYLRQSVNIPKLVLYLESNFENITESETKKFLEWNVDDGMVIIKKINLNWNIEEVLNGKYKLMGYPQLFLFVSTMLSSVLFIIYFITDLYFFFSTTQFTLNLENITYSLALGPFVKYSFLFIFSALVPLFIYYYGLDALKYYHMRNHINRTVEKHLETLYIKILKSKDQDPDIKDTILILENSKRILQQIPIYPLWNRMKTLLKYSTLVTILIYLFNVFVNT